MPDKKWIDIQFTGEFFIPGIGSRWIETTHLERYRFATQFTKGKVVLDIACGTGYGSKMLADAGALRVDGVDIQIDRTYAKNNFQAKGLCFYEGDIVNYKSNTLYDIIVCFETIEHVEAYCQAISNLRSLLKKDCVLIISSPNRVLSSPKAKLIIDKPENPFHVRGFTVSELILLLKCNGFSIDNNSIFGQGYQIDFLNYYLTKAYRKLITRRFGSNMVTPLRRWQKPNYVILIAKK